MTDISRIWCSQMKNLQKNLVITWRFQLVSTKNKHNSSVVTGETMMCLSASPGAHGDAVRAVVCYTAVFSVVTQRSSPLTAAENRTTFLSRDWPVIIQFPFSGRCSRNVCGTVTPPITALLLSVPHV